MKIYGYDPELHQKEYLDLQNEFLRLNIDSHKDLAKREKKNRTNFIINLIFATINSGLLVWQIILQIT